VLRFLFDKNNVYKGQKIALKGKNPKVFGWFEK